MLRCNLSVPLRGTDAQDEGDRWEGAAEPSHQSAAAISTDCQRVALTHVTTPVGISAATKRRHLKARLYAALG
jgi:hypothetical protein